MLMCLDVNAISPRGCEHAVDINKNSSHHEAHRWFTRGLWGLKLPEQFSLLAMQSLMDKMCALTARIVFLPRAGVAGNDSVLVSAHQATCKRGLSPRVLVHILTNFEWWPPHEPARWDGEVVMGMIAIGQCTGQCRSNMSTRHATHGKVFQEHKLKQSLMCVHKGMAHRCFRRRWPTMRISLALQHPSPDLLSDL